MITCRFPDLYLPPHNFPAVPCPLLVLDPELEPKMDQSYQCHQGQFAWDCDDSQLRPLAEQGRVPTGFDEQAEIKAPSALLADSRGDLDFLSWNADTIWLTLDLDPLTGDTRMDFAENDDRPLSLDGWDNVRVDKTSESEIAILKHWDNPFSDAEYVIPILEPDPPFNESSSCLKVPISPA